MRLTVSGLGLPFEPWPHQSSAIDALLPSIAGLGYCDCPVMVVPTGGGKTRIMVALAFACKLLGLKLAIYTHRRMLTKQAAKTFSDFGVHFGVRASGHKPVLVRDVQVSAIDTERCRSLSPDCEWQLHDADVVIFDEAHEQLHATAQTIASTHLARGARLMLGLTATPVNCAQLYNRLIVGATKADLRECGAHVPIKTYAPTEGELSNVRRQKTGEYSVGEVRKAIMTPTIVGHIEQHWRRLNPDARPAILFAPCVESSIWLCSEFKSKGIVARHIDSSTSDAEREDIEGESRDGICKIVANRFVLRTGIDWDWLYHGIFATIFGGMHNWLQAGGRLQRHDGTVDHKICQDHGGNWHRHCSLNDDVDWQLTDTPGSIAQRIIGKRREQTAEQSDEPICCPKCQRIRRRGPICPHCGHKHKMSCRVVLQTDGSLEQKRGRVTKHKPKPTDLQRAWNQAFYAGKKNNRTLNQVRSQFVAIARRAGITDADVPFGQNGKAMLRNCPDSGSVLWAIGVSDYLNAKKAGEA